MALVKSLHCSRTLLLGSGIVFENNDKLGDVDQYRKFHSIMIRLQIRIPNAAPQSTSGFRVASELEKFKQIS